ncbi:hydantoinase/oxoprolinase family protein [Acidisoma cellulosilytica]|uniref:Hydantoinase/oxoprolinase family protein n=1 Tax=Acidisoma cellulosilyticum TaxID=2802395 RepID=A0A964E4G8_9PROT|nr:hydantoinase/oxoprolinase family protein [Acidisoma cellulosilyticum]MCB8881282.1 hydantoinase/oxoprolinase family protein [Acidisoma cellulosilyticum]
MISVGIDVGGTFTDFVSYDRETGQLTAWKNLSTPADPTEGILTGLESGAAAERGLSGIRLGTTVATNALLEGKGAVVGYITTAGFRDIPFIGRGNRRHHYDLAWVKPKPFLKRRHAYEIAERIGADGQVMQALDEDSVRALARQMRAEGEVEAVAVMFMHSYIEPAHERRVREILAEELPEIPVSISYDVLPKWKEHFRSSTTLCDAFVKPVVRKQLGSLRARLDGAGVTAPIVVMRSNGGEMTLDAAAGAPIQMAVSGPTGGVIAGKRIAGLVGIGNVVTLDMGGTSTDVSTIVGGEERFTTDFEIEWGRPVQIPMIDIRTIGAGGGSLARVDAGGMLTVGPQSAGARPGPACYGRGGTEPTVTDANVVLGRIAADNFLGGAMALDTEAARAAVARVADQIGLGLEQTALSIIRIANNTMVGALHTALTEQGLDPRDFTLMPFGGAGPLHVCELMEEAAIPRGLVPNFPGQFSAFGFILADARVDRHRTVQLSSRIFDQSRAEKVIAELEAECRSELAAQGHSEGVVIRRSLEMRYAGQNYELEVPLASPSFGPDEQTALWEAYHLQHLARFGFRLGDALEIVTFIVTGIAATAEVDLPRIAKAEASAEPLRSRPVWFDAAWVETPVYDRAALRAGHVLSGPALVEEEASVTVVSPGHDLNVDDWGNLHIVTLPSSGEVA